MTIRNLSLVVPVLLVVGCAKPNGLVGTWTNNYSMQKVPVHSEETFAADGTYESTAMLGGAKGKGIKSTNKGTWKLEAKDKLKISISDINWEPQGMDEASTKRILEELSKQEKTLIAEANKLPAAKLEWKGEDKFTLTAEGVKQEYERK
ncbi:MAG TPA: hypothetical protein PLX06_06725 [Fimbriimonadaceae bacterium]|nr:hypothetical protein [Fimbriimonadaceae bacterium]